MDILALLQSGPKTTRELADATKGRMAEKTLHAHLKSAVRMGKVLKLPLPRGQSWTSLFALPRDEAAAIRMAGYVPMRGTDRYIALKMLASVERLRARLLRNPEASEILADIGESPEDASLRDILHRVAARAGWSPPTPEERAKAAEEAAWLKSLGAKARSGVPRETLLALATPEEIERAGAYVALLEGAEGAKIGSKMAIEGSK
ncbi:MAG: hypothetical protein QXO51_08630 [Halobacteria archaeon]